MSEHDSIAVEIEDQVMRITLNRPGVLNSFDRPMGKAFQRVLDEASNSPEVRSLLLTGAGRAFCAGQDLAEALPRDQPPPDIRDIIRETYNPSILKLRKLEKPVVCAVNGVAAGAGANLALACDLVLAADTSSFIQAFSNIALIPDTGGSFFLPRLAGLARATRMAFLGEKIPAATALEWGLIYRVCPAEELPSESLALALRLAKGPTRAYGLIKRAFNASLTNSLEEQLAMERELQGQAAESRDFQEGVRAFQEKRAPRFKGC